MRGKDDVWLMAWVGSHNNILSARNSGEGQKKIKKQGRQARASKIKKVQAARVSGKMGRAGGTERAWRAGGPLGHLPTSAANHTDPSVFYTEMA